MNEEDAKVFREAMISQAGYELVREDQREKMEFAIPLPSESKEFHRKRVRFQIHHPNPCKRSYDLWDKLHSNLGMPRSSLKNAILDGRLDWDPKKSNKNPSEGKPFFTKIKTASFFPVTVITQMEENGQFRIVEYVKLDDGNDYRVVYEWSEKEDVHGEYDARIISLHRSSDKRGREFIKEHLSLPVAFGENRYAIWFPRVPLKGDSERSVFAFFEYP